MYRVCNDDFEFQAFQEMISPPAVAAKKRAEILFHFDAKVSYLSQKRRLMSNEKASVLLISHHIRNFAYHRDYHNPKTISVVGRILYKTVCEILPILARRGHISYSSNTKEQAWTKRYGVTAELFKFPEALQQISDYLGQRIKITPSSAARTIRADLFVRYKRMRRTMIHWLGLKKDKALNNMLKHYEFADAHSEELQRLRQPVKDARYMVYELHKGLLPGNGQNLLFLLRSVGKFVAQ